MRNIIVRAAIFAALIAGASLAFAFSTGPPASRTGVPAFASKTVEPACNVCHGSGYIPPIPLNHPSGKLEILDVPRFYLPNVIYNLRLKLSHTWDTIPPNPVHWGFEMQALSAVTGDSAGTWILGAAPPDSFKIVKQGSPTSIWKNRRYLEHTLSSIHEGAPGPVEWHMKWKAPTTEIGKVYFAAAGNSANGDFVSVGSKDFIFTDLESTNSANNVDVPLPKPMVLQNDLQQPYPNPLRKCADLSFTIAHSGRVELAVFDLSGRRVRTILDDYRVAGSYGSTWTGQRDNGTYSPNGVYFIRLRAPGESKWISRKVTLAR